MALKTWIVFLRGIGGGIRSLAMKDLMASLEALGCKDVRTYIQTGNIVLRSPDTAALLSARVAKRIAKDFGFEPGVVVLSLKELKQAASGNPYSQADENPKALHLFFLSKRATAPQTEKMNAMKIATEAFVLSDKVFYFYAPAGFGTSKLGANIERLLGVPATARNWRTVGKVIELAGGKVSAGSASTG